jgi:glycosyltransferase involved in cell wall biosynthesis
MKIVHIGKYDPMPNDGVGKTILEQIKTLSNLGISVEIWTFSRDVNKPTKRIVDSPCPVWLLPLLKGGILSAICFPKITIDWIRSRLSEVDCFHLHSVFTPTNNLIADLGKPYIITPNGGWSKEVLAGSNWLAKWVWILIKESRLWNQASSVQAVSNAEFNHIKYKLNIPHVEYVPNGTEIPTHVAPMDGRDILLYMGRYAMHQKGLDRLVQAILHLKITHKKIPKLVLAGADFREGQRYLNEFVCKHQLENEIEIHGPLHGLKKEELFNSARVFIHTSRWEGLPLVLLEAISYGIPCLLTKGTNVAEEWQAKGCALMVEDAPGCIAQGIVDILKRDPKEMSDKARKLAGNEFSWQKIGTQLIALYQRACV